MSDETVATVASVEDGTITLRGVGAGEATLAIRSMNNRLVANLAVRVVAA